MSLRAGICLELTCRRDGSVVRCTTRVEEIAADSIWVGWPLLAGIPVPFSLGERISCRWADPGGAYGCETRVVGECREPLALIALSAPNPGAITKVQRREFVRLDCRLAVRYATIPGTERRGGTVSTHPLQTAVLRDLSGGGAALVSSVRLPAEGLLDLFIELPSGEVYATGQVVRALDGYPEERGFAAGVRFVGIGEAERSAIIRYIFTEQRVRRRKGQM